MAVIMLDCRDGSLATQCVRATQHSSSKRYYHTSQVSTRSALLRSAASAILLSATAEQFFQTSNNATSL